MKIADVVRKQLIDADPFWAEASADLAHALMESATRMTPEELRAFVADTSTGSRFAGTGDKELQSTAKMVAEILV